MEPVLNPDVKYVVISERGTVVRCFSKGPDSLNDACEFAKNAASKDGEKYYVLTNLCHTIVQLPVIGWL